MGKLSYWVFLLRKQLVLGFTLATYFLSVYYFFFEPRIIRGIVFSIFFFGFIHYFIIELKKTEIINLLLVIIVLTIFLVMFKGFNNLYYVVGIILFNIAVFFLCWDIYEEVYNRIDINSYKVFTMGVKIYSLLLSAVFALSFLGTYRTFNITCNQIYHTMKSASNYAVKYFSFKIPDFTSTKVKDIIPKEKLSSTTGNIVKIGTGQVLSTTGTNLTGTVKSTSDNITFSDVFSTKFWKNIFVNQIMENKKALDKNLCEMIVQNIKEKYNKPHFQVTVLFFIFLLFYPFIRIILYVLAIINFIAFKLTNVMKLYRFKKVVEDVEIIE